MTSVFRVAVSTMFVMQLVSCTTVEHGVVRGGDDVPMEQRGIVSGSFGCDELGYFTNYHIFFRSMDKKVTGGVHLSADGLVDTQLDWNEASWKGIAFRYALPPGKYEFYNVEFFQNGYPSTYSVRSKHDFSAPFEVRQGENTYLGEIKCHHILGKNMFGRSVPVSAYFVFSDLSQRDLHVIHKKFPETLARKPHIQLPAPLNADTPFIRAEPK